MISAIHNLQVTTLLPCFESIDLLIPEKKFKIDFQDDRRGDHLGLQIKTIVIIFYLHVTSILHIRFRISSVQEKTFKIGFQIGRGGYLGFQIRTILDVFLSKSHPISFSDLRVNYTFHSGE